MFILFKNYSTIFLQFVKPMFRNLHLQTDIFRCHGKYTNVLIFAQADRALSLTQHEPRKAGRFLKRLLGGLLELKGRHRFSSTLRRLSVDFPSPQATIQ